MKLLYFNSKRQHCITKTWFFDLNGLHIFPPLLFFYVNTYKNIYAVHSHVTPLSYLFFFQ